MPSAKEAQQLVAAFPQVYAQAVEDWAKFKVAADAGVVPPSVQRQVLAWFHDFPRLWQGIAPNWRETVNGQAPSQDRLAFANQVDRWVIRLRGEPILQEASGLGLGFIIIAGIALAAAFGLAGVAWGLGYIGEQRNISALIEQTASGRLPPDILRKAVDADKNTFLGQVEDVFTKVAMFGALALAAWFFVLPALQKARKSG